MKYLSDDQLIRVLRGIALSDHLRDVGRAIRPIMDHLGIEAENMDDLLAEIEKRAPLQP